MRTHYIIGAIAAAFIGSAAQATTLTFDTAADCSTADVSIATGAGAACSLSSTAPSGSSSIVVTGQTVSYWTATFSSLMGMVSVDLGDNNSDEDSLFLTAFDAGNTLLGTTTLNIAASSTAMHTLSLTFANISSVTFGTSGVLGFGGIYADNLTFSPGNVAPVPLPAGLGLLVASLFGLGVAGRRRKAA